MTSKRTYGQLCGVARAMDLLGERWTVLIVRELLLGPKRFKDLLERMPTIGPNRLTGRLQGLAEHGIVRRTTLPAPAGVAAYELTEFGEGLRAPLVGLGLWALGTPPLDGTGPETLRAESIALAASGVVSAATLAGARELYDLHIGDEHFHLQVGDGQMLPRSGPAPVPPDVKLTCDLQTFVDLVLGKEKAVDAIESGALATVGERKATQRAFDRIFDVAPAGPIYLGT
ncbi:winged helix-turn-helix transcriptional regulator [Streptomyces canus]|uniref:winged helix-turn-helix transcriptional regulator n=1 Tax=Streptomyces canus TaxID=58343 RepID=UPI002E2AB61B|nr:winged helix-turn-helix transcriptional regulator [Streptomyces canus]